MAKCPNCGKKLKWYEFRAECKSCGTNIPNYNWEARLEEDADKAETSFAKLHYRLSNFKSATVGSPFRIIRLVATLLPLVGLVVPLMKVSLSLPFYEDTSTVSFLTLILNYITKLDFMGGFQLMSATALGSRQDLIYSLTLSQRQAGLLRLCSFQYRSQMLCQTASMFSRAMSFGGDMR